MRHLLVMSLFALLAGCASRPDPVPISGSSSAVSALAGTWLGQYEGRESGRSGSITFIITAAGDSAFGDVVMVSDPNLDTMRPVHSAEEHMTHVRSAQALRIDFVAVAGGSVTGTLEPYIAPDCNCRVSTTFTGRHSGNAIEGTFVTRGPNIEQHGTWRVVRDR